LQGSKRSMSDSLKINLTILPEEGLRLTFPKMPHGFRDVFLMRKGRSFHSLGRM